MPSETALKAAGTYIKDSIGELPTTLAWATEECRTGSLSGHVKRFCEFQQEILEPALVLVEQLSPTALSCRIPCKVSDHEATSTFEMDVCFTLNPATGECLRVL